MSECQRGRLMTCCNPASAGLCQISPLSFAVFPDWTWPKKQRTVLSFCPSSPVVFFGVNRGGTRHSIVLLRARPRLFFRGNLPRPGTEVRASRMPQGDVSASPFSPGFVATQFLENLGIPIWKTREAPFSSSRVKRPRRQTGTACRLGRTFATAGLHRQWAISLPV